jgi:membrane protein implicated in regulation of membrane protease activity
MAEADHQVMGKVGRVTGSIEAGRLGEVMIPVRGGTEAFYAYAVDTEESIPKGTRVVVIDHEPPRTLVVSRLS